jgi:hypothetical protein
MECNQKSCKNNAHARGMCPSHYAKWRRANPNTKLRYKNKGHTCYAECNREAWTNGLCRGHVRRLRVEGQDFDRSPIRTPAPPGSEWKDANGYVYSRINGKAKLKHRTVMEEMLKRKLLKTERVHHKNGLRHDNSPSNLELWTTHHPTGQRVQDAVLWAKEIIELYG